MNENVSTFYFLPFYVFTFKLYGWVMIFRNFIFSSIDRIGYGCDKAVRKTNGIVLLELLSTILFYSIHINRNVF